MFAMYPGVHQDNSWSGRTRNESVQQGFVRETRKKKNTNTAFRRIASRESEDEQGH